MFILAFIRWLLGWARFEAEGGFPERLLNLAARGGVSIWDTGRRSVSMMGCCYARKYKKLRPLAKKAGARLHVAERHGLPFFLHRYRARGGLVLGLASYIVLLQILSSQIWVIQVSGNEKVPEKEILAVVEKLGVRKGEKVESLDIQALQLEALQRLPDLVWLTVNPQGSIAHIEVAERQPPPAINDKETPSNLVAERDGRILRMEVYGGQAAVKEGDAVVKGTVLVTGAVETTVGTVLRRAQAKIYAQTSRTLEVTAPLREVRQEPDGRVIFRPTIELFGFRIPLYTDGPLEGNYRVTVKEHPLTANGLKLPFGLVNRYYHRLADREIVRTEEEARLLAEQRLADLEQQVLGDADIQNRQVQGELLADGYRLTARYDCIEEIGLEQPLEAVQEPDPPEKEGA